MVNQSTTSSSSPYTWVLQNKFTNFQTHPTINLGSLHRLLTTSFHLRTIPTSTDPRWSWGKPESYTLEWSTIQPDSFPTSQKHHTDTQNLNQQCIDFKQSTLPPENHTPPPLIKAMIISLTQHFTQLLTTQFHELATHKPKSLKPPNYKPDILYNTTETLHKKPNWTHYSKISIKH